MSDLLQRDAAFDNDEDNNPFPAGGLASMIQKDNQHQKLQRSVSASNSNARIKKPDDAVFSLDNSPGEDNYSDDEGESLILFQEQDENTPNTEVIGNTTHISHESRVTRILAPGRDVHILINEAGKSNEGLANALKKYIVYTIKLADSTGDELQTRRRYSDFESLREILTRIFPLVVIPPIPPKNYFSLNVLNGFVGTAPNGSSASNGPASVSGTDSPPRNGPSYSYINSSYLNKRRLVEHRKRLLSNFLNNCLLILEIRKLDFFAKFLDPTSNWSDEVNLITSQLPKSVYQLNPENGLATDTIYASLPVPVSNHSISLPFLNSIASKFFSSKRTLLAPSAQPEAHTSAQTTSTLVDTIGSLSTAQGLETSPDCTNKANIHSSALSKSHMDELNKRIISNYIGLTNDYIELGAFLNSFAMIIGDTADAGYGKGSRRCDGKVDVIFDRIGLAFDNSLNTVNLLISELETKFSEPLGEAVKYTSVFESTKRFKAKKVKQSNLVDHEIKEKRKELADSLRAEMEVMKIEKGIQTQSLNKSPTYSLGAGSQPIVAEKPHSRSRFLPSIGSMKKITKYVSDIMDQNPEMTRRQRITQLQDRIIVLEKCQTVMQRDISYITDELSKNAEKFRKNELKSMFQILLNYNRIFLTWARRNIEVWEEAKEEIAKLDL